VTSSSVILTSEGRRAAESGRARKLRLLARLSQREFAQALEVTPAAIARWEAGERLPRDVNAERLALLLREIEAALASTDPSESATPAVAGDVAPRRSSNGKSYPTASTAT